MALHDGADVAGTHAVLRHIPGQHYVAEHVEGHGYLGYIVMNRCTSVPVSICHYRSDHPEVLEAHLRAQRLSLDVTGTSTNAYGLVFEVEGPIRTPSGRSVRFCSAE